MKRLLRSIINVDNAISQENLTQNLQKVIGSRLEWARDEDKKLYGYVLAYFQRHLDIPALITIKDSFEKADDVEVLERIKDVVAASSYTQTNFTHLLQTIVDEQNKIKAVALLKESQDIITKGLTIEGEKKIGVRAGLQHFSQNANTLIAPEHNAKLRGELRSDGQAVWSEYEQAKFDKGRVWGRFCGLNEIDKVCHGIKKGELWVHAAYAGELKCLSGDVTIYDHSTNRRRTIAEMYAAKDLPVVTALDREGETFRLVEAPASHLVENGVKNIYDLRLSSGRKVGATSNHKFFTPQGWVELGDLQMGDFVAVPRRVSVKPIASRFTDSAIKVVGYLIGDGHISNAIGLTVTNDQIREDFKSCLIDLGLLEAEADYITPTFREVIQEGRALRVEVSRSFGKGISTMVSPVAQLLESLGLYGTNSYTKFIPDEFFGLSEIQTALLLGALWSTDGSCHAKDHARVDRKSISRRNDISYASVSERLCLDIQSLLLRLEIQSSVTRVDTEYKGEPYVFHTLRVTGNDSKRRFTSKIKVIGKETSFSRLAARLPERSGRSIPSSFIPANRKIPYPKGYFRHSNGIRTRPTVTLECAARFATAEDHHLVEALEGDLDWDRVVSVTFRGIEMTYDLSVPEHHTFVANDIITHNTTFATNWAYNLVTRYRSNVFYVSLEMTYEHIRRLIYVVHSANQKWKAQGFAPLDYRKVRDGELSPEEETFFRKVIEDFTTNEDYGTFHVWRPDDDVTTDDIKMEAEIQHKQEELGLLVIDHGGLVEPRKRKRNKDFVIELNSVIRDTKKLALNFNHGEAVPILLLFQINRQGKDEADKNEGRYKMKALAYSNECLVGETLVRSKKGYLPLVDVKIGDQVWSSSGWKEVLATFDQGKRETYKVKTTSGLSIKATDNHRLRVLEEGSLLWKRVDELVPGRSYLVGDFGTKSYPEAYPTLPSLTFECYDKPFGEQGKPLLAPQCLTEGLAYLMGAYAGDGVAGDEYRIGFTGNRKEKEVRDRITSLFEETFNHPLPYYESHSRPGSFDCAKWSKSLKRWFMSVGMDRKPGVPPVILSAPKSGVIQFLKGLWDTDGSINNQYVLSLCQKEESKKTLEEVQLLMLDLGIETTLSRSLTKLNGKEYPGYTLRVRTQESRLLFASLIGFTDPSKTKRLSKSLLSRSVRRTLWPVGKLYLDLFDQYARGRGRILLPSPCVQMAKRLRTGKTNLVTSVAMELLVQGLTVTQDPRVGQLSNLLKNTRPLLVKEVGYHGLESVYDIEVGGDHEYASAGVYSHNCERSADVVTTTYLNDEHRKNNTTVFCNLKNRDNPLFDPFEAEVHFASRRIKNREIFALPQDRGMHVDLLNEL